MLINQFDDDEKNALIKIINSMLTKKRMKELLDGKAKFWSIKKSGLAGLRFYITQNSLFRFSNKTPLICINDLSILGASKQVKISSSPVFNFTMA